MSAILVPFGVAYAAYLTARLLKQSAAIGSCAGLVCGYLAGHTAFESRSDWAGSADSFVGWLVACAVASFWKAIDLLHPHVARDWVPWLVLAAVIVVYLDNRHLPHRLSSILRLALAIALPTRLLWSSVYFQQWSFWQDVCWIGGIGLAVCAAWELHGHRPRDSDTGFLVAALVLLVAGASSLTVAMSGSIMYAQLGGVLTSALVGILVGAIVHRDHAEMLAAAGPLCVVFGSLLIVAYFFAALTGPHAVMLALAFLLSGGLVRLCSEGRPVYRWLSAAIVVLLVSAVVLNAGVRFAKSLKPTSDNPYAAYR